MTRPPGTPDPTTVEEFEEWYALGSDVTVEWLHEHDHRGYVCFCGDEECLGFAMMTSEQAAEEIALGRAAERPA